MDIVSNELQLILASCKHMIDAEKNTISEGEKKDVDQDLLLRVAFRHQVVPVLYHFLKKNPNSISPDLLNTLKDRVLSLQLKGISTKAFLRFLTEKIQERNIKVFLLKGVYISEKYYGDIGMRDAMDLDLLVEADNLEHVVEILHSLGYKLAGGYEGFTTKQKEFIKQIDYHFGFINTFEKQPKYIELHWALRNRFGNFTLDPFVQFQNASRTVDSLCVLHDIDNFLFLCTHASEHAFYRLKWLFDVYIVYSKSNFDMNILIRRSFELNCSEQMALSFLMLEKFMSIEIPEPISKVLKEIKISQWLIDYCTHQIIYEGEYCDTFEEKMMNLRFSFFMNRKGFLNKRLLKRYLTSPNDWKLIKLPDQLFFLYYLLRPFLFIYRRLSLKDKLYYIF